MYIDRVDITLANENVTTVTTGVLNAEAALTALPSLSPGDRKHLPKIGLKNEALALQIIEVGRANPDLIPRGIDFAKIDRDLAARGQVNTMLIHSQRLTGRLLDSKVLLGVDIYAAALSIYHSLKRNANTTSLQATVEELTRGFARARQSETEPEPAPTAPTGA